MSLCRFCHRLSNSTHASTNYSVIFSVFSVCTVSVKRSDIGTAWSTYVSHIERTSTYHGFDFVGFKIMINNIFKRNGQKRFQKLLFIFCSKSFGELFHRGWRRQVIVAEYTHCSVPKICPV